MTMNMTMNVPIYFLELNHGLNNYKTSNLNVVFTGV